MKHAIFITAIILLTFFNACKQDQTDNSKMDHSKMDHNSMDHSTMSSEPNAANAPFDLQFIDTMIHHHEAAVDMAKMAPNSTKNADLLKFTNAVIIDQSKEMQQMADWRKNWFDGKPAALNMEIPGMKESMKMDMKKLGDARDKEFDLLFIEMMIPHHEGAITMSKDALEKSEHAEIKTLANQIIKAQEAEIKMMQEWKTKWTK